MKKALGLMIALFSVVAIANTTLNNTYKLNNMGGAPTEVQLGTLVNGTKNLLVARYSFAKQGGTTANDISLLTDLNSPRSYAVLPANAVIQNVWVDILTSATSSSTSSLSVKAVNAADLLASTNVNNVLVGRKQGVPDGTTTKFIKLSASKTIKATISTTPLTAGKFDVFIEYVIGNP